MFSFSVPQSITLTGPISTDTGSVTTTVFITSTPSVPFTSALDCSKSLSGDAIGAIVGGVIGGVIALIVLGATVYLKARKNCLTQIGSMPDWEGTAVNPAIEVKGID